MIYWQMARCDVESPEIEKLLKHRWEPFAISDFAVSTMIWFRRRVDNPVEAGIVEIEE
jgi:hypothetical protein